MTTFSYNNFGMKKWLSDKANHTCKNNLVYHLSDFLASAADHTYVPVYCNASAPYWSHTFLHSWCFCLAYHYDVVTSKQQ